MLLKVLFYIAILQRFANAGVLQDLPTDVQRNCTGTLYDAARDGNLEMVKCCIINGADVNGKDEHGRSVLHIAAWRNHLNVVKYLVEDQHARVDIKNPSGTSPLHWAIIKGKYTN